MPTQAVTTERPPPPKVVPSKMRTHIDGEPLVYFDHQLIGIRWLLGMRRCILADVQGLGKTLQTLTAAAVLYDQGKVRKALVICSKSLQGEWENKHIKRFTHFECLKLNGRSKGAREEQLLQFAQDDTDILVIGYEQALAHKATLSTMKFDLIVVDEAHKLKSPTAKRTKAVHALRKAQDSRWYLLSGTPIRNHPGEIWSLLWICDPQKTGTWWPWKTRNLKMGGFGAKQIVGVLPGRKDIVRQAIDKVTLRRLVEDCVDLPPQHYVKTVISLNPYQAELYVQIEEQLKADLAEAMREAGGINGKIRAAAMTASMRLTMLCSTPATLAIDPQVENPEDREYHPDYSTKLDRVVADIVKLSAEGEKCVLGSRFKITLTKLQERLAAEDIPTFRIDGDVSVDDRHTVMDDWRAESGAAVFMGTFQTISEGLTLTDASHSFLVDPLFVPGDEWQFIKRTHRIGMDPLKPAYVHVYVTEGTYEERIEQIREGKEDVFESLVPNPGVKKRIFDAIFHSKDFDPEGVVGG